MRPCFSHITAKLQLRSVAQLLSECECPPGLFLMLTAFVQNLRLEGYDSPCRGCRGDKWIRCASRGGSATREPRFLLSTKSILVAVQLDVSQRQRSRAERTSFAQPVEELILRCVFVSVQASEPTRPLRDLIEATAKIMPATSTQPAATARLALWIFGSICVALVVAALVAGLWYFLRGRREKRTPETPQNMMLQRPAWPTPYHFCRAGFLFSRSASRSDPRALRSPCRLRHAPRSSPRARLQLQARRCLLSNNAWTPIRPRAG